MSLRVRLLLTCGAIAALLAVPALYGVGRLSAVRQIAVEQRAHHAAAHTALGGLQRSLARLDRFLRSYLVDPDQAEHRQDVVREFAEMRRHLMGLLIAGYVEGASEVDAELTRLEEASQLAIVMVVAGERERATDLHAEVAPLVGRLDAAIQGIAREVDQRSLDGLAGAQRISDAAARATLGALGGALILALALALWMSRAVVPPLQRLRHAMALVAGGRFDPDPALPYERVDEIGDLTRSYRHMTQRLGELDRMRAEFVSITSHDLRTPLNVIGGYAELIGDGLYGHVNAEQREVLHSVQEQTRTVARLVDQLLDISRIEAGGLRLEMLETDVRALLGSIEQSFGALAGKRSIAFAVRCDPAVPRLVTMDVDRIRDQVLGNLLSNALKFTAGGGSVVVSATRGGRFLVLDVEDTGTGIPADQLPHIFEKYHQVGSEARGMGSGLGLAIAREVTEAHQGRIEVASEPGRGTRMRVMLPIGPRLLSGDGAPARELEASR